MQLMNELIGKMVEGKVGYYLETPDSHPCIEVFRIDTAEQVGQIKRDLEQIMKNQGLSEKVTIDTENLDSVRKDCYRVMMYMSFDEVNESELLSLVDLLKVFGSTTVETAVLQKPMKFSLTFSDLRILSKKVRKKILEQVQSDYEWIKDMSLTMKEVKELIEEKPLDAEYCTYGIHGMMVSVTWGNNVSWDIYETSEFKPLIEKHSRLCEVK